MKYIIYILMFAAATVIVFSWGIIKEQNKSRDLMNQLYKKAENNVVKAFKRKDVMTFTIVISRMIMYIGTYFLTKANYFIMESSRKDIENEVKNVKASLFYSRDKMVVQNPRSFTKSLINTMINNNVIEKTTDGYILKL